MRIRASLILVLFSAALAQENNQNLLEHWKYDHNAPLNVKTDKVEERGGAKLYQISYSAPLDDRQSLLGPNGGQVTASLVVPSGEGPFPALIYGHWCMPGSEKKNRTEFLDEALLLARVGVISLLPDHVSIHPGFVEDKDPLSQQQIAIEVQQLVNLRRGADLLLERKDVDRNRLAYVGHSCDAAAGGYLSGIDKRFKAFVLMAGDLSNEVDRNSKGFQEFRQKVGAEKFDAFLAEYSWMDPGKYVSHAAPAAVFLQYATEEPFLTPEMAKQYFERVSEPKKLKIYESPHALNAEATRDRIAFLSQQLSFKAPSPELVARIPALVQPPWPKGP